MGIFHGPGDPVYTISIAARLLRVSPHLLRQFEMEGLIMPARTDSNIRLYSDNDLRLLARVIYLFRDCGINTQGIKVILAMEGDYRGAPERPSSGDKDSGSGDCEDSTENYAKKNQ